MGKFLRFAAVILVLGLLAVGVMIPDFLRSFRFPGDTKVPLEPMGEELERQEQVNQGLKAFHRDKRAKLQVAEEVIAGRLSVAEALEAFRRLQGQQLPIVTKQHMLKQRKMSEDEWLGDLVLYYVKQVLADRPDEAAAVIARLEKELQELLADRKKYPAAPVEKPIEPSR
jgi:hypothetical protein